MNRKQALQCSLGFIVLVSSVAAFGNPPTVIHYRGHLDVPSVVPAGTVQRELTFNLYEMDIGGSPIWTETQVLDIYDGNYAVILGAINPVTAGLFTGSSRYLGVQVGADPELTPRQRIAAVPYSMQTHYAVQAVNATHAGDADHADDADTVGGGQVSVSTQGVHIDPASISETVYVDGSIDATGFLSCGESLDVAESVEAGSINIDDQMVVGNLGAVGRGIDTSCVFHINENDSDTSPSTLDRFRVTTVRRYGLTPITQWHLVVSEDGYVGINTSNPQGNLDVNGPIYQRGGTIHPDYVFEDDFEIDSIEDHAQKMWKEKHLPAVPSRKVDEEGQEIMELRSMSCGILEELEFAHIYIEQLNREIKDLREEIKELKKQAKD